MLINIKRDSLWYGAYLGYKLSRLEWIWGSPFEFALAHFESSKKEVLSLLPLTELKVDESSYKGFCQSILNYYLFKDIEVFSAIQIGICIQRSALIGASDNEKNNEELKSLAYSSLLRIPNSIIPDREKFYSFIISNKTHDFYDILSILEKGTRKTIPTLFLSYCSKDKCIADIIEDTLNKETNNAIRISRYSRLPYKQSFKHFMNGISEHDYVLCIVSDGYLKSQACMYEVGEAIKDHNYDKKLLFVVLNDNDKQYYIDNNSYSVCANIYGSEIDRLKYVSFWKDKYDQLKTEIERIDDFEATARSSEVLNEVGRIYRNDISEFLSYLADYNGKTFEELYSTRFIDIQKLIIPIS